MTDFYCFLLLFFFFSSTCFLFFFFFFFFFFTYEQDAELVPIEDYDDDISPEWIKKTMRTLEKATWRSDCSLEELYPTKVFCKLLKDCQRLFHKEPTVVDVEVPRDACINVVGDTHGQYHDVMTLFAEAGLPSETNLFVFNGDFVDRGAWGVEVLSTFLSWKVLIFIHSISLMHSILLLLR